MDYSKLLEQQYQQIQRALLHLKYSYDKVLNLSPDPKNLSTEDLETWEGFIARFARVSDIFLSKYLRTFVLKGDPAFRGSLRDFVDQAEKLGLLDDAEAWMAIRELRNLSAHEYTDEKLLPLFVATRVEAPRLLALCSGLKSCG